MLRIQAGERLPVSTRIDSPAEVIKRLSEADLREGKGLLTELISHIFSVESSSRIENLRLASIVDAPSHMDRLDRTLIEVQGRPCFPELLKYLLDGSPSTAINLIEGGYECSEPPWKERICGAILSSRYASHENIGADLASRLSDAVSGVKDGGTFVGSISDLAQAKDWLIQNHTTILNLDSELDSADLDALLEMEAVEVNLGNLRVMALSKELSWAEAQISLRDIRSIPKGLLSDYLFHRPVSVVESVLEQAGHIDDDGVAVTWALRALFDHHGLAVDLVRRATFSIAKIGEVEVDLWSELLVHKRIEPNWENLNAIVVNASGDSLETQIKELLDHPNFRSRMEADRAGLELLRQGEVDALAVKLLGLGGSLGIRVAEFMGASGAIPLLSANSSPILSKNEVAALTRGLDGVWVPWVYLKAQLEDQSLAAAYLSDCVDDENLVALGVEISASVLVQAVRALDAPESRMTLLAACMPLASNWTESLADDLLRMLLSVETKRSGSVLAALGNGHGIAVVAHATLEWALGALAIFARDLPWSEAKPFVVAASDGFLSGLDITGSSASLTSSDSSKALSEALYKRGVVRKPTHRARTISIQSTTRFNGI